MKEFYVSFRSRSHTMRFFETVQSYRLAASIVNTPKKVSAGCGLSVKMFYKDLQKVKMILMRGNYQSLNGIYYLSDDGFVSVLTL